MLRLLAWSVCALPLSAAQSWPDEVKEVRITSSADQTAQPSLWWTPSGADQARPLLVGLHTWSGDFRQTGSSLPYWEWCRQEGWHFLHPDFRGPNRTPAALGSDQAVQDILDAVDWAKANARVDVRRIYLIGVSGGGHMALLMAGRHPEIWAGVSAWCGIADVARWHTEHSRGGRPARYAADIERALGGPPDIPARAQDARRRSPLTWLSAARGVPLDIAAGVHDGRKGSVPFRHSLEAYNAVVAPSARIPAAAIAEFYATQRPAADFAPPQPDPLYGLRPPVFRTSHGNTRVTIFEGAHEIIHEAALNWLAHQEKGRPAAWTISSPTPLRVQPQQTKSGL
jgi:pimeloyl-ACP methyl ester carboxylesterase